MAKFSNEFVAGMTTPHRTRILGDVGENAPEQWDWGGPAAPVDAVLLLYAKRRRGHRGARADAARRSRSSGGSAPPTSTASSRSASATGSRSRSSKGSARAARAEATVRAGEFLLGYTNEYGQTIDEPLLRNGSYLVFRQLSQDVAGFWRFVDAATRRADG